METIADILRSLEEIAGWLDGESIAAIRSRLTSEQLAGPGDVYSCIVERQAAPWLLRVSVKQTEIVLFEVAQRLPQALTHAAVEAWIETWKANGNFQSVEIVADPPQDLLP